MVVILKIQAFLENFWKAFSSVARIVLLSKWRVKIKKQTQARELVLLGNGPSLHQMIADYSHFLSGKDLICVNHFPVTDYYEQLKPAIYMASAPDLWLEDIDQKFIDQSIRLFDAIAQKTSWHLKLFFPYEARKYKRWQKDICKNPNIEVVYYNNIPIEGWTCFEHFFYKRNIGMPRPHNVMIPSIFTAINLGYRRIYLWGVDHSWLSDIFVDEQNNALINQKHFYDEQSSKAQTLDKRGRGARKLHEILHKFMLAFAGYHELKKYADKCQVEIINNTANSFIDAFKKQQIDPS